jgi:pimeloyl-ACP methyl ester carboxylesterase
MKKFIVLFFVLFSFVGLAQNWRDPIGIKPKKQIKNDFFGKNVSISGNTAAIGACYFYGASDAVYILEKQFGSWVETHRLVPDDLQKGHSFGSFVLLKGDYLFVGAESDHSGVPGAHQPSRTWAGSVYIFRRDLSGQWKQLQKIVSPYRHSGARFYTLAAEANILVIGEYGANVDNKSGVGRIHILDHGADGLYRFKQTIVSPDTLAQNGFGFSLSMSHGTLVVASRYQFIYVFTQDEFGIWKYTQRLVQGDGSRSDDNGTRVDVDGNFLVSIVTSQNTSASGKAFVYTKIHSGTWTYYQTLDLDTVVEYGPSISIDNRTILVSHGHTNKFAPLYIYEMRNDSFRRARKFLFSAQSNIGLACDVFDQDVLVGNFAENTVYAISRRGVNSSGDIDPVGTEDLRLYDPNPVYVSGTGLQTDIGSVLNLPERIGAVTDGKSRLLLVMESNDDVTLTLPSGGGMLSLLSDQENHSLSLTLSPYTIDGKQQVMCVYTPPARWNGQQSRDHGIPGTRYVAVGRSINGTPISDARIVLSVPPVVLVHGMWGSPQSWGYIGPYLERNHTLFVGYADYSNNSASSFDPHNDFDDRKYEIGGYAISQKNTGALEVSDIIHILINDVRDRGFACASTDAIGHSLGGLMIKSFIKNDYIVHRPYFASENYNQGYINRMITIGTPHSGSPFGPKYVEIAESLVGNLFFNLMVTFEGMYPGPCQLEFDHRSDAINSLADVMVSSRSIVSTVDYNRSLFESNGLILDALFGIEDVMGGKESDLIVPLESQLGGKDQSAKDVSHFFNLSHTSGLSAYTQLTSQFVRSEVFQNLLSSDPDIWGEGYKFGKRPVEFEFDIPKTTSLTVFVEDSDITITSPIWGDTVNNSGDTLNIQVSVANNDIDTVYVSVGNEEYILDRDRGFSIQLRGEFLKHDLGRLDVFAFAFASENEMHLAYDSCMVSNDRSFFNYQLDPRFLVFDSLHFIDNISFRANYYNQELSAVDLSHVRTGTAYETLYGDSIITINENGVIIARSIGVDTITVSFRDFNALIPVLVTEIDSVNATLSMPKSSQQNLQSVFEIQVYPNPTRNQVTVTWDRDIGNVDIVLRDVTGRVVFQNHNVSGDQALINVSGSTGLYVITVKNSNYSCSRRVIKI